MLNTTPSIHPLPPCFPNDGPAITTPIREAAVSVARFAPTELGDGLDVAMPPEDAFALLFQLREHPAHDFWSCGKFRRMGAAPRFTLSALDLRAAPRARMTQPIDKLIFHLPRAALREIAEDAGASPVTSLTAPWNTYDPVIEQMHGLIVAALQQPECSNRLLIDHIMLGLSAHFLHTYGGMRPCTTPHRGGLAPWQEERAKELLAANLTKDISLQEIAAECGLSLGHFARAFKVSTGAPPHRWLQSCRLERATHLMLRSRESLATIALECGFADQSHFSRNFSRAVGITPANWRRLQA